VRTLVEFARTSSDVFCESNRTLKPAILCAAITTELQFKLLQRYNFQRLLVCFREKPRSPTAELSFVNAKLTLTLLTAVDFATTYRTQFKIVPKSNH